MSEITQMDVRNGNALAINMSGDSKTTRRLRSVVWNDFTKEKKPDGNCVAICNHCKKQLTASSRSGTTHLKNHLTTCLSTKVRVKRRKLLVRRKYGEAKDYTNDGVEFSNFQQEASRRDLARMVMYHGYPFTIVRHAGFRTFVKNLQPHFKLIPDDMVRADCMKIYEDGRVKLHEQLEKLPCRVSVAAEMWRSREDVNEDYMCLTCHYVDDNWRVKSKILNFLHVEYMTSGEEISKMIAEKLEEWNIHKKLFIGILDYCSASEVVASELPKFIQAEDFLPMKSERFNVQGAASVLNLIAHDFMEQVGGIISKVRDSILYLRSSQEAINGFQKHLESVEPPPQKQLHIDDPDNISNGISLTVSMLQVAYEFRNAFSGLAEDDEEYANSLKPDWEAVFEVTKCLEVFDAAIKKFSTAIIPTANLYFYEICLIHCQLVDWRHSSVTEVADASKHTFGTFEQYWNTIKLMAVASILDPRYKMGSVEYFFKQIYGDDDDKSTEKIEDIRNYFVEFHKGYVDQSNHQSKSQEFLLYSNSGDATVASLEYRNGSESKPPSHLQQSDVQRGLAQYLQKTSSSQPQKTDLDLYLEEPVEPNAPDDKFNILAWWKHYSAKYPVLVTMARDILGIPASSCSSDIKSRTLDENLCSLDSMTVQGLKCGQDWLREEFDVYTELPAPADGIVTIPINANMDGDVSACMIQTNGDEYLLESH